MSFKKTKKEFRSMYNCIDISYLKYKDHKSVLIHYSENSHIQQRTVPMKMISVIAPDMETCVHLTSSLFPLEGKTPCQSYKAKIKAKFKSRFPGSKSSNLASSNQFLRQYYMFPYLCRNQCCLLYISTDQILILPHNHARLTISFLTTLLP